MIRFAVALRFVRAFCAMTLLLLTAAPARSEDTSAAEVKTLSDAVLRKTAWVNEISTCPAQLMQARPVPSAPVDRACYRNPTSACMVRCERGVAGACYWLGQGLMRANVLDLVSETLFQRSCKLGDSSGCTNRAAGMQHENPEDKQIMACVVRTYEKTCAQDDPWGCTMFGLHLVRGIGITRDPQRALQVMSHSCRLDEDDPACTGAKELRAEAQAQLTPVPQKK